MSELGALSQYALSIQNMQMALIKNQINLQQQAVEVLLEAGRDTVPVSETRGTGIDISV